MPSPHLNLPDWVGGQNNPHVTVNDQRDGLDRAMNEADSVDIANADYALTADNQERSFLEITSVLTADRNITLLAGEHRQMTIENATTGGFNLVVKYAVAGDTVAISPGRAVVIQGDGTNVKRAAEPDIFAYPADAAPQGGLDYVLVRRSTDLGLVKVLLDNLPGGGGSGGGGGGPSGPLLHVRDEKADGTHGGSSVADTWVKRTLNTVLTNEIAGASLSADQITLPAGTYFIWATAPANATTRHKARLQNVTDPATTIEGGNEFVSSVTDNNTTRASVIGQFTIAAQKAFELQDIHQTAAASTGLGVAIGDLLTPSMTEVYSEVLIWQKPETGTLHVRHQELSGVQGGASVALTWNLRILNTVLTNEITGASLATNQITLPAGKYRITASAPAYVSDMHKLRFRNTTDASDTLVGTAEFTDDASAFVQTRSLLAGQFTIAATKTFELQHYTALAKGSNGLGNATSAGVVEVYGDVFIERLA